MSHQFSVSAFSNSCDDKPQEQAIPSYILCVKMPESLGICKNRKSQGFLVWRDKRNSVVDREMMSAVPAGAFTWLNRHHDFSAAQQGGAGDMPARSGRLTESLRQPSVKLSSTAPMRASQQPRRQPESEASSAQPQQEQSRADSRAFKSTDAGWESDSSYWKSSKPGSTPGSRPQSSSGQSASMPNWVPRAAAPQSPSSQQSGRPEPAKASQAAPRLR